MNLSPYTKSGSVIFFACVALLACGDDDDAVSSTGAGSTGAQAGTAGAGQGGSSAGGDAGSSGSQTGATGGSNAGTGGTSGSSGNAGTSGNGGTGGIAGDGGNSGTSGTAGVGGSGATAGTAGAGGTGAMGGTAGGGGSVTGPCVQDDTCTAYDKDCVGLIDNSASNTPGFRMQQIDYLSPHAFTSGIVYNVVHDGVILNYPTCRLMGQSTVNWLLQFDLNNGTVTAGSARYAATPDDGYTMMNETVDGFVISPVDLLLDSSSSSYSTTMGDANFIVFLNQEGTSSVMLPLRKFRLSNMVMSPDRNCIGQYNAMGLSPAAMCLPDMQTNPFVTAGTLEGYISLEDADIVPISAISNTLCVLLSENPTMYGDGQAPMVHCKRTNGIIDYQGNWCSVTNAPADANCHDAVRVEANFAAASVLIQ